MKHGHALFRTFIILQFLLFTSYGISFLSLGMVGVAIAYLIAGLKGSQVAAHFMEVKGSDEPLYLLTIAAVGLWSFILFFLSFSDYMTR